MSTDQQVSKQFKVKLNSLKRIQKDLIFARKELTQEKERLEKMQNADGEKDEFRIRQQKQVIEESKAMVPDAVRRFKQAGQDLEMFIERETLEEDLQEQVEEANALVAAIDAECKA